MNQDCRDFKNVQVMWHPDGYVSERRKRFIKHIEDKYHVKLGNYWDLHKWSIENLKSLWTEVWEFSELIYSRKYDKIIDLSVPMNKMPKWFEGARLNFAENLLKNRSNKTAMIIGGEERKTISMTYAEVYEQARLYAAAFRKFGIKKGDVITCYMSNREEAIFAMLGVVSIGAIWTGDLPLMGAEAVLNRFKQTNPRVMITIDRFKYDGKEMEMLYKLKTIGDELPNLEKIIIVPSNEESKLRDISGIKNSCFLDEFLQLGIEEDGSVPDIVFEQVPVSHPVFIIYTSGTTGLPKGIVHGCGGLFAAAKDGCIHNRLDDNSCLLSNSPVGWASWNMFAQCLFTGVKLVVYEGVPYFLSKTYLWDLVDELKITTLFITPGILDEFEKGGFVPTKEHNLESLLYFISGASVVKPNNYDFVYNKIKKDVIFGSGYGCTELLGSCMGLDRTLPIHRGEISCPTLAIDLECVDESGNPVVGELGELVIKKPIPFMPLGLWGDTDGSLFEKTYFSKYPGKFSLGDLALVNPITKGIIIFCRSDETLNPQGVRFGSSEIYNIVNKFPDVRDSLCVAQYSKTQNERVVLFVKMKDGFSFNKELIAKIKLTIEKELSLEHVPELVLETSDIPYNMTGKKMEIIVKKIINNMPYNADTVVNKTSLKNFENIPPYEDSY